MSAMCAKTNCFKAKSSLRFIDLRARSQTIAVNVTPFANVASHSIPPKALFMNTRAVIKLFKSILIFSYLLFGGALGVEGKANAELERRKRASKQGWNVMMFIQT
jgi:hypothetical protein